MNSKTSLFLQYTWLIIGIGALAAAIHQWLKTDLNNSMPLFAMALISGLMFIIRRRLRKRQDPEPKS